MKTLKKILLINWLYFSKQLIEVGDINFLTGKNGAGKSTIIDALQIVFLGELNTRNFNKAANESSQRTLNGYLRADMDEKSPCSRRGKDFSSYIACEFLDDQEGKRFVTGIVFDCRNDGSRQERFFIYDGPLPEHCFLVGRQAMDIPALRKYLTGLYGARAKLYDSHRQYRTDMLAKWNVHNEQVCRMLKKAVSFRPIVDIQQFITENICDIPDKPDTELMQQNIRDYKRHEQLAKHQEEKLGALQKISDLFREMQAATDRLQQQRFLVLWAEKEDLESTIHKHQLEMQLCRDGIAHAIDTYQKCKQEQERTQLERDRLYQECVNSDVFQAENRLRNQKGQLEQERNQLAGRLSRTAQEIKRETQALCRLCQQMELWTGDDVAPLLEQAGALEAACRPLCDCTADTFSKPRMLFEQVQTTAAVFSACLRETAYRVGSRIAAYQQEQDQKEAVLANLRRNVKDYPKGLLALKFRLTEGLERQLKRKVSIEILADVLEIAEDQELWRKAVEGYLNTQKFYLLFPPEVYPAALHLYDQIKHEFGRQSFGLVDIGKLREKENIAPWDDSLAKKIETDNPLARTYIDYLLGRVVCCTHVSQLRKHKTAITADGMVYQNYVARPMQKERMEDAFIGRKAIALRMERTEQELSSICKDLEQWKPIYQVLDQQKNREFMFTQHFVQGEVAQRQEEYLRGLEIGKTLDDVQGQLDHLDLFLLADMRQKIAGLDAALKGLASQKEACVEEKGKLEERIHALEFEVLPGFYQELTAKEDTLSESFTPEFQQRIGLPRYEQELARLKRSSVVAKNFGDRLQQTIREQRSAQQRLFQSRTEYVRDFQPCSFRTDAMDNDEFAAEQETLEKSELPKYREKIQKARDSAMEQFQNDFLSKLRDSIEQVEEQVHSLNKALKQAQFGTDQYQFYVGRNPDYAEYYDMIKAPELMEAKGGLFTMLFQKKYGKLIEDLFSRIATADDTQLNAKKQSELQQNIDRYTDFRTYLKFDLETTDQNGNRQMLSQTLNTKSGGETQTPFYIAVLASFAQIYQVNNLSSVANNTVRLVLFDEAFNKMDSDRIIESVRLLRKMHLQAIICTPPDKLPDIMPLADRTLLVSKEKYHMHVLTYGKEIRT